MADNVASHYSENLKLAASIAEKLQSAGKDLNKLTTAISSQLMSFIFAVEKRHWN